MRYLGSLPREGQGWANLRAEINAQDKETVDCGGDAEHNVNQEWYDLPTDKIHKNGQDRGVSYISQYNGFSRRALNSDR